MKMALQPPNRPGVGSDDAFPDDTEIPSFLDEEDAKIEYLGRLYEMFSKPPQQVSQYGLCVCGKASKADACGGCLDYYCHECLWTHWPCPRTESERSVVCRITKDQLHQMEH